MRAVSLFCGGTGRRLREGAGQQGRRAARAEGESGGGRECGLLGGAHPFCGLEVHPLFHEAGEFGEVALPRRLKNKGLLRLRA